MEDGSPTAILEKLFNDLKKDFCSKIEKEVIRILREGSAKSERHWRETEGQLVSHEEKRVEENLFNIDYTVDDLQPQGKLDSNFSMPVEKLESILLGSMRYVRFSGKRIQKISHQNIVALKGSVNIEGNIFLILENCVFIGADGNEQSNERLHNYLKNYKVTPDSILGYALDIARGLFYLHIKQIAYRDLSLKSILVHGTNEIINVRLEHPAIVIVDHEKISQIATDKEIASDIHQYGELLLELVNHLYSGRATEQSEISSAVQCLFNLGNILTWKHLKELPRAKIEMLSMKDVVTYLEWHSRNANKS